MQTAVSCKKTSSQVEDLWDSSISDVACSCSHFAFSHLKNWLLHFTKKKFTHTVIWFTDCYVFTLLYPLKNMSTSIVEFLAHGDIFWKVSVYIYPRPSHCPVLQHAETEWKDLVHFIYHLNDVNVNGRQTDRQEGKEAPKNTFHACILCPKQWVVSFQPHKRL